MKKDKLIIVALIVAIIFLLCSFGFSVAEQIDYNKRKASGNARWNQVEERIINIEKDLNNLKVEVEQWKRWQI